MRHATRTKFAAIAASLSLAVFGMPPVPAHATPPPFIPADIQALLDGLGQWGTFTQSLATNGPLGQALPLVNLTPGSPDGLGFGSNGVGDEGLIGDAVHKTLVAKAGTVSGTVGIGDLASGSPYAINLGDGRTGSLTVSGTTGTTEGLTIGLDISRTVTGQGLAVTGAVGAQPVSLTSTNGVTVTLHTHVAFSAWVRTGSPNYFYVAHDGSGPSVAVDAKASIPTPNVVDASIGILGVALSAASFSSDENLSVSFDDPNSDGQLAFLEPDGVTKGELAQPGASTGLVHVTRATPAGSVTDTEAHQGTSTPATFTVTPKPLQLGSTALPDVTLAVSWPDVSTGAPTITNPNGNLPAANDFLNLGAKDLANGLEHLATTVDAVQRSQWGSNTAPSGNQNLPFMKGTLADAVDASAALSGFVTEFTYGPANPDVTKRSTDPVKRGSPTFASIQDLIADFNVFAPSAPAPTYPLAGHATITVGTISFNDGTAGANKLLIPLTIATTAPGSAVNLDVQPILASGSGPGVTYGLTSMTDSSLGAAGFASNLAGQQVQSGTVTAIIDSVSGDTLNLKAQTQVTGSPYWVTPPANPGDQPTAGTKPTNGALYQIVGGDPQSGALKFGNAFGATGISRANADASKATVSPSYTLNLGLVLDLEPAVTGTACHTNAASFPQYPEAVTAAGCPFQHTNPDGSTTTIGQLPVNTDRTELRTGSVAGFTHFLTADFPITSPAPDDFAATVGYLGVHLAGQLQFSAPSTGHMRTIDLQPQTTPDKTLDQIVRLLVSSSSATSSSLLTDSAGGALSGSFAVDVPGSSTSSSPSFFGQTPTCSGTPLACVTIAWGDINTGSATITPDAQLLTLNDFNFDTTTPTAIVSPLVKSLQVLDGALGSLSGASATLGTQLPVVAKSVGSLAGAQDSGGGPNVTYGASSLTDKARPFDTVNDPLLAGHTMTVGTAKMTIATVAAGGGGTMFTFTKPFSVAPATGTAYTLTSAITDAVGALAAQPPATLQKFLAGLQTALGGGSTLTIGLDTGGTTPALVVNLNRKRVSHTESTASLTFDTACTTAPCPTAQNLIESPTASPILTTTTGNDTIGVEVPLADGTGPANAAALKVTNSSQVGADLAIAGADTGAPAANIGPLAVNLGDSTNHLSVAGAYHVAIGSGSGSGVQALSTFLAQTPTITSPGAAGCSTDALCATVPIFTSAHSDGPVTVAIPKASPMTVTGNVTDTNVNLGDDIKAAQINFGGLLGGIDNYFALAEQGLNAASFNGKLPLIGSDLQQGSDFVGKLKGQFDAAVTQFTSSIPTTAGGIKSAIESAITGKLPAGVTATATVACAAPLVPPGAPSVTRTPSTPATSTTATYRYEVLSTHGTDVSTASPTTDVTNDSPLSSTTYNSLSWSPVDGADGYIVLRAQDDSGGNPTSTFDEIAHGSATTFKDVGGAVQQAGYTVPSTNPTISYDNCPGSTSIQYVTKVAVEVKAGDKVSTTLPFNIGIPGLSLSSADASSQLTASAAWNLDLTFGVDKSTGFFVKADGTTKVLSVNAEVTSPSSFKGQLAFLNMGFTDKNTSNTCGADTNLGSDACLSADLLLNSPSHDGEISTANLANPSELSGAVTGEIKGGINLDWGFLVDVTSALPGISGEFVVKWNPSLSTATGVTAGDLDIEFDKVAIDAGSFLSGVLGPILKQVKAVTDPLQPVVDTLTAPIPVLSDLSHLAGGGDVTLLTIAEAFNTLAGGPDLSLINRVVALVKLFNKLSSLNCTTTCAIPLGDYKITSSGGTSGSGSQQLLDNTVNPESGINPTSVGSLPTAPDVGTTLSQKSGDNGLFPATTDKTAVTLDSNCAPSSANGTAETETAGLTFPVIEHPLNLFRLLLGQDISLACFDSGVLTIGFSYSQAFGPVYAPPPVLITISGSASASLHIVGGFDTYGLRTAAADIASGHASPGTALTFLDSLFFTTTDSNGNPIPVVTLTGTLAAGAEVSVVLISVGVQGGITLTINFTWRDPDNDGKFRFDEFLSTALSNPLCLFNISGSLSVFLELDITLGISPFDVSFSITLVNIKLLDFSIQPNCTPPPPQLAGYDPGSKTLVLYMGSLGTGSLRGDSAWDNGGKSDEAFKVTQYHQTNGTVTGVAVDAMGVHDFFPDSSQHIDTVYMDAKGYTGAETVVMQGGLDPASVPPPNAGEAGSAAKYPFTAAAIVYGGNGNDTINTGQGASYVDGGPGDDHITTADIAGGAKATISGGAGNDTIRVGNADDFVSGDAGLIAPANLGSAVSLHSPNDVATTSTDSVSGVPDWHTPPSAPSTTTLQTTGGGDGNDVISLGLGADTAWGGGGDDKITVAPDNAAANLHSAGATIIGGDGSDTITGGNGPDHIYTGRDETFVSSDDAGSEDACTAADVSTPACHYDVASATWQPINKVDTGGGIDTTTNPPTVVGGGNDFVYGSQGVDIVSGHSAPNQTDTIYGGGADDVLTGGFGTDAIYGGPGNDYLTAEPSAVSDPPGPDQILNGNNYGPTRTVVHNPLPAGVTASSKTLVGGAGNDHIYGGNGGAKIFGDSDTEPACPTGTPAADGYSAAASSTVNNAGDGNDYIIGGSGQDIVQAGGGNDFVNSGSGNDFVCGGGGDDTLITSSLTGQTATVYGGSGNDLVTSGAGNDYLFGNDGNDTLYAGSGNDTVEGNDGTDTLVAGGGNDLLVGGSSTGGKADEGDRITAGGGNDVIIGDNGAQVASALSPADLSQPGVIPGDKIMVYDLTTSTPTAFGGNDHIFGGSGNDQIFGGLGDDVIYGGSGTDHIEGNTGSDTIYGGTGTDDILGGTSPVAVAGGSVDAIPDGSTGGGADPCQLGSATDVTTVTGGSTITGNCIYGDYPGAPSTVPPTQGDSDVIVGGNGSITPTGVVDSNDGQPVRAVTQLALLTIGGNDHIFGGPQNDQIFGGLGNDVITTGNADNYVEGGPGDNTIYGGRGSNDIIGGTSPLTLPTSGPDALTTDTVPSGQDLIYADGLTGVPPAGPQDGGNVVLGDNGCISRDLATGSPSSPPDANGCPTGPPTAPALWAYNNQDPASVTTQHPYGVVSRTIRQLNVADCPNSSCSNPHVQGGNDTIYGGTGDDVLLGETGNDQIFGGPPGTTGGGGTAGLPAGNDYMEGGAGSDTMAGGAGADDMIGGSAPTYLPPGITTAMISDGTSGSATLIPGGLVPPQANPLLSIPGSGVVGNTMDGGDGADVMIGGNGQIGHPLNAKSQWLTASPAPGHTYYVRTAVQLDLAGGNPTGIGGDDTMRGGPGDDRMFGGIGNDNMDGGSGDDYLEGGPGRNILQGGGGDDDLVGGTSPVALPVPASVPAGFSSMTAYLDSQAANMPNGTPAGGGTTLGNIICGYYCGGTTSGSDDDAVVATNGRIDRCAASTPGTPAGSDGCLWTRTDYGKQKVASAPGVAQPGTLTNTSLGSPRTRFTTLLGQDPNETTHNANTYVEGNSGNDVIYGGDGSDAIHGDTPAANSPRLDECLPTNDSNAGQDIVVGGYGNDVLCGDGGDDALLGNRGLVRVKPFSGSPASIGTTGGAPYGVLTTPASGNTIYQVDLSQEYVDGNLVPVPNWNNPTATGQASQHDIIFGGQGNDSIHGSPGDDFLQGDDGMHIAGQGPSTGGDDILFGGGGNDSMQGGPGNDHEFGGAGNDDMDVIRSDSSIPFKVTDARACQPMLFPTITVDPSSMLSAMGCPTGGFGLQSYASRFPLVSGTYNTDPGAADNGGTAQNSTLFGDILYGGFNRDVSESQAGGLGDRMIDDYGAYNLEFACPAAYGGYQINRALSPSLITFLQNLTALDGAVNTSTPTSSGGTEASIIYANNAASNTGPNYPTTPGHFTC